MKNLLERMKTYNFWISLVSAVILVLRIIGDKFHFFVDATLIMDITTGLCGIFVVLGIISAPSGKKEETKMIEQNEPVGRFEQVLANAEEDVVEIECVDEDVILAKIENEDVENEMQENVTNEEVEDCNVENDVKIEENIQETIQNAVVLSKIEESDKQEITELLTILLEKINSL